MNNTEMYDNIQSKYPFIKDISNCAVIYENKMKSLIGDKIYMNEFYNESPNFYKNTNFYTMFLTFDWLSKNNDEKIKYLDNDLDDYFE